MRINMQYLQQVRGSIFMLWVRTKQMNLHELSRSCKSFRWEAWMSNERGVLGCGWAQPVLWLRMVHSLIGRVADWQCRL